MSKIDDFLFNYKERAISSMQNLDSLERAFHKSEVEFPRLGMSNGKLPFLQFGMWLSRKFRVTTADELGCWPRYNGSCWRVVRECIEKDEQYNSFFELYGEFRKISAHLRLVGQVTPRCKADDPRKVEVWKCSSDSGYLKYYRYEDGLDHYEGFFASLEDLMQQSLVEDRVAKNQWTRVGSKNPSN